MSSAFLKGILTAFLALVSAASAYWYRSPYLALHDLRKAALARDINKVDEYIDYTKVRESIKRGVSQGIASRVEGFVGQGVIGQGAGAAAAVLLRSAADPMVDSIVRPERIGMILTVACRSRHDHANSDQVVGQKSSCDWAVKRVSIDRIMVSEEATGSALVFDRRGFATWRLTQVRIPE